MSGTLIASCSSSPPERDDVKEEAIALTFHHVASTLYAVVLALHRSEVLRIPLLPHYRQRYIFERLGILRFPHVPSTDIQRQIDAVIDRVLKERPPLQVFNKLLRHPHRFERLTRFSVAEFILLYVEVEAGIQAPYSFQSSPPSRKKSRRLHPVDQLLLWLWHGDGNDADILAILFGEIGRSTADRIVDHVTAVVNEVWAGEVTWPDAEERRSLYGFFTSCPTAVGVLDGTHCQIEVPVMAEASHFSAYKKFHTQNYLICADALGFVIWTAGPFAGHDPDRAIFNTTPFVQSSCPLLSQGEVILVDGGFKGEGHIVHQFTMDELRPMTEDERARVAAFNEDFSHNRSPVEHCIHRVKSRMQALAKRWPRALHRQAELFNAATKVYNRCRRLRMEHALAERCR